MTTDQTRAPTDLIGGMPATQEVRPLTGTPVATDAADPLTALDPDSRRRLADIADRLIPAAHGMPSAAEVVDDERLRFVLRSRPDLVEPLVAALRTDLGDDARARLEALANEEPTVLAALQLVIVAGYYTDARVRELIGYPGQLAIPFEASERPPYMAEGLIDAVLARGPVWRDPRAGQRAAGMTEGGHDGRTGS